MKPFFSIIIPAYNEENYIKPTLHSIKNQTYQNFETIVVANGCNDKTEEIVKKRADERLRILSLPKANVCVARNAGALNASGEVLVFLDADTQLSEDSLQTIKNKFLEQHAVATTTVVPDTDKTKFKILMGLKNFYLQTKIFKGFSGVFICKKEHFQKSGGYNPEIIIKEHHQLRKKLEEYGGYTCINTNVITSMRRFKHWSVRKAAGFWLKQWTKYYFGGDLRTSKYEQLR